MCFSHHCFMNKLFCSCDIRIEIFCISYVDIICVGDMQSFQSPLLLDARASSGPSFAIITEPPPWNPFTSGPPAFSGSPSLASWRHDLAQKTTRWRRTPCVRRTYHYHTNTFSRVVLVKYINCNEKEWPLASFFSFLSLSFSFYKWYNIRIKIK